MTLIMNQIAKIQKLQANIIMTSILSINLKGIMPAFLTSKAYPVSFINPTIKISLIVRFRTKALLTVRKATIKLQLICGMLDLS